MFYYLVGVCWDNILCSNIIYDGQFRGNVLIAGKEGFGKTYFMQKLTVNDFFGKIVKIEWVKMGIQFSRSRKAEIQSSFSCDVSFHYPQNLEDFRNLVKEFQLKY